MSGAAPAPIRNGKNDYFSVKKVMALDRNMYSCWREKIGNAGEVDSQQIPHFQV